MPAILRYNGYTLFFFSNEGNPREPAHVHVRGRGGSAKIWLEPEVRLAQSFGIADNELGALLQLAKLQREHLIQVWEDFFDD
ncbi:DUF4160 domain-containing protein [Rugamonas rubra]|uniref:DUF4160 domain-containing protein n=1 Tax=Rugamonas rubra TaxID=758825 RepID=A0A1I4S1R8_9BURK|nr:DUF4160 domain-containing protein [Rugamonas rubra]SFM58359.1 protein of unknown function [Rugamonas rubra]